MKRAAKNGDAVKTELGDSRVFLQDVGLHDALGFVRRQPDRAPFEQMRGVIRAIELRCCAYVP